MISDTQRKILGIITRADNPITANEIRRQIGMAKISASTVTLNLTALKDVFDMIHICGFEASGRPNPSRLWTLGPCPEEKPLQALNAGDVETFMESVNIGKRAKVCARIPVDPVLFALMGIKNNEHKNTLQKSV